jgi:heptosyltransferase-2
MFGDVLFRLAAFRGATGRIQPPRSVLVVKLDRLGDVALSACFLAGLREAWPASRITLVVRESLVDFARLCPAVDEVIGAPVKEGTMVCDSKTGTYVGWWDQLLIWLRFCQRAGLWQRRFEVAIVPRWGVDYYGAVPLAYISGAAERWAVGEKASATKDRLNRGFDALLTHAVPGRSDRHELLLNHTLLELICGQAAPPGPMPCWAPLEGRQAARDLLERAGIDFSRPVLALCLGAGHPARQWPAGRYAELCSRVFPLDGVHLATFGTESEKPLGREVRAALGEAVVNLEGAIPLRLLPSALSLCALYIGGDTGPMHLAAAAGLPVLEISCHPTDGDPLWPESPRLFSPWGVPSRVVQPPAATPPCAQHCEQPHPHCILGVTVEQVTRQLQALLAELHPLAGIAETLAAGTKTG